jgi:hypothetical protein
VEPATTVTTARGIVKAASNISKKLYAFGKGLKDREAKQQVDEILDQLRELKQSASQLEDENRELRDKMRSKATIMNFARRFGITERPRTARFENDESGFSSGNAVANSQSILLRTPIQRVIP